MIYLIIAKSFNQEANTKSLPKLNVEKDKKREQTHTYTLAVGVLNKVCIDVLWVYSIQILVCLYLSCLRCPLITADRVKKLQTIPRLARNEK